jgi:quercetin dioxygenase-like cupin family protein
MFIVKSKTNHLRYSELPKVPRGLGIVNHLIASKKIGAQSLHSGITYMPPGTSVPAHSHNTEEQVTILEGTLKIIMDGKEEVICKTYDSTFLSAGVQHELINDTDEHVLAMVIYGSAHVNRTFTDTGETVEIGSERDTFPPPE